MDTADWVHLGVTAFLFCCFCGCAVRAQGGGNWWLAGVFTFLILLALAAGWTGWSIT